MAKQKDDDDVDVDEAAGEAAGEAADEEAPEEKAPRPRTTTSWLTLILCLLNILAAVGFIYLLSLDFGARQAWSLAIFKHDLALEGLPLIEEDNGPSASRVTFPRITLDDDQLKKVFTARGGKGFSERFQTVVLAIDRTIRPMDLSAEMLKEWFKGLEGSPVKTLEEEVQRLMKDLPAEIARAADAVPAAAKTVAEKRSKLEADVLRLAYGVHQIEVLDGKLKAVADANLDPLLKDVAQRRMLFDILAPLDVLRPAELKDQSLETIADFDTTRLETYVKLLERRLSSLTDSKFDGTLFFNPEWSSESRESIDKRHAIAITLFIVAQAKKPDGTPLYSGERLQAVIGLYEYAAAAPSVTAALLGMQQRIVDAIKIDRDGSVFESKGKIERNAGFIRKYQQQVQRIQELVDSIKKHKDRHVVLLAQLKEHQDIVKERKDQVQEITKKLLSERAEEAKLRGQLEDLQKQVFQAKLDLITAHQENQELEREIGRWEGRKGGKAP
jgi:hypothetical protein